MNLRKAPTKEELLALGVPEQYIADKSTDPPVTASSWDVYANDRRAIGENKLEYHLPHIRPASVLVTPIGQLYDEGVWWRLQDMLFHTAKAGHSVSLQEMRSVELWASDAIFVMRWEASMLARDGGVEWLLMVDTDTWLEKDTLLRLLAHDRPVVFPFLEDMEQRYPRVMAPMGKPDLTEPGHGLVPVRWAAMSCMLFNVKIFNVLDPAAWRGDDFVFAQCLNFIGHRIYVDTDTVVKVVRGPSRLASKTYDEFWEGHAKMWDRIRLEPRDRRPPPNFDPLTDDGVVDKDGTYHAMYNHIARGTPRPAQNNKKETKLWLPSDH